MAQLRVYIVIVKEIRARIGFGLNLWERSEAEHCIEDSQTYLEQNVHNQLVSSPMPQRPVSHRSECELSCVEAIVQKADSGMGSNMYWHVPFPHSAKNMIL